MLGYGNFFFGAPKKNIYCFNSTISGCDGGNRTRKIAVNTWRFSHWATTVTHWATTVTHWATTVTQLSYNCHPTELQPSPYWATTVAQLSYNRHPIFVRKHFSPCPPLTVFLFNSPPPWTTNPEGSSHTNVDWTSFLFEYQDRSPPMQRYNFLLLKYICYFLQVFEYKCFSNLERP